MFNLIVRLFFLCIAFCLCFSFSTRLSSDDSASFNNQSIDDIQIECSSELRPFLQKILKIEDARRLIDKIQKEGTFRIIAIRHQLSDQFGAFWDIDNRQICVNLSGYRSEGSIIGSILFELHNAAVNAKFDYYDGLASQGKITKEQYVRAIEYIEYENSISASNISKQGIELKIFPPDAYLHTYRDFDEHYYYQQVGGHSQWIGKSYDDIRATSSS